MHHNNEQSKFTSIHLCALTLKESAYSIPHIKYRYSGQMNAEPVKVIKFTIIIFIKVSKINQNRIIITITIKKYNCFI